MHDPIEPQRDSVVLRIRLQPKASRNAVLQVTGESVRVAVTAPPVNDAANHALIVFLSKVLGVKKAQVEIVGGKHSRTKSVRIQSMESAHVHSVLASAATK